MTDDKWCDSCEAQVMCSWQVLMLKTSDDKWCDSCSCTYVNGKWCVKHRFKWLIFFGVLLDACRKPLLEIHRAAYTVAERVKQLMVNWPCKLTSWPAANCNVYHASWQVQDWLQDWVDKLFTQPWVWPQGPAAHNDDATTIDPAPGAQLFLIQLFHKRHLQISVR